ncbi:glycosyltransferase family 39 protein [Candidatus Saccharibacteria bacterium]|nr:glycosyltransferase family 39 protein [Candidatus Saccharibacteria bacterium]
MSWFKRYDLKIFIAMAVLFTFVTGLVMGMGQQLWFDESYSLMVAQRSVPEIIDVISTDVHPPVYYIALHAWGQVFGFSEMSARILSVIFYSAMMGLVVLMLAKMFGKKVAIMAVPILIVAPFLLRYGFEVRMYSLAALIAVGSTYVLYNAWKTDKWKWWGVYAVLVALGMYTLYVMGFVFVAHLVWLVVMTLKAKKSLVRQKWVPAYLVSMILFLPWLPILVTQFQSSGLAEMSNFGWAELLEIFSFGFLYAPVDGMRMLDVVSLVFALGVLVLLVVLAVRKKTVNAAEMWLVVGCLLVPILILAVIGSPFLDWRMYSERYLAHVMVFGYAAFAVLLATIVGNNKRRNIVIYVTMALVMLFGVNNLAGYGNFNFRRNERPNTREVARELAMFCQDKIIADDPYLFIEIYPYMPDNCNYYFWFKHGAVNFTGGYAVLNDLGVQVLDETEIEGERVVVVTFYNDPQFDLLVEFGAAEILDFGYRRAFVFMR